MIAYLFTKILTKNLVLKNINKKLRPEINHRNIFAILFISFIDSVVNQKVL